MNPEAELAVALHARVRESTSRGRLSACARALARLGNPHRGYRVVHLTGTNGKTSTSRITDSLLRAQGFRTGMFTSPDLGHITQRICIDGAPACAGLVLDHWREVATAVTDVDDELRADGQPPLSFFEAVTVLALYTFARERVDVAVVEVGRGGAWDATNVVEADVAVFAPIGIDHTAQLGRTVAQIATVKSGIIKPGSVVVCAEQAPEATRVLEAVTRGLGVQRFSEGVDFGVRARQPTDRGQVLTIEGLAGVYDDLALQLYGAHQSQNAAVAIAAAEALTAGDHGLRPLDIQAVREGIGRASSPGRLELVDLDPVTIVDAAHNPHGAAALVRSLEELFPARPLVGVVALAADKHQAGIFATLSGVFQQVVVTTAPSARTASLSSLAESATRAGVAVIAEATPRAAIIRARQLTGSDGAVVVFGSIMLTAVALEMFAPAAVVSGRQAGARVAA